MATASMSAFGDSVLETVVSLSGA